MPLSILFIAKRNLIFTLPSLGRKCCQERCVLGKGVPSCRAKSWRANHNQWHCAAQLWRPSWLSLSLQLTARKAGWTMQWRYTGFHDFLVDMSPEVHTLLIPQGLRKAMSTQHTLIRESSSLSKLDMINTSRALVNA